MKSKTYTTFDTIIFDLDGVLVDVSKSYLVLPILVTKKFYNEVLGLKDFKIIADSEDVVYLKNMGGFNNDWDITYYFVDLLFHNIYPNIELNEEIELKKKIVHLKNTINNEKIKIKEINLRVLLKNSFGNIINDGYFKLSRWLRSTSEDIRENLLKRLFQEMYLGKQNLKKNYKLEPLFYNGKGLITKEKLLISKKIIKNLSGRHMLALATGRDKIDTDLCLKLQSLDKLFKVRITDNDVIEMESKSSETVSLRKPHPFIVEKAIHNIKGKCKKILYVGDNMDDIKAANALKNKYNIYSAGFLYESPDKKHKEKLFNTLGADIIFRRPKDLLKI